MTSPIAAGLEARPGANRQHQQLRTAAHQLEGMFLNQLFQAMRKTVDAGASGGEQMFTGMLDEELALMAAEQSTRGLGEALYRQMSRRLPPPADPAE